MHARNEKLKFTRGKNGRKNKLETKEGSPAISARPLIVHSWTDEGECRYRHRRTMEGAIQTRLHPRVRPNWASLQPSVDQE
jgi:hypothetical protein